MNITEWYYYISSGACLMDDIQKQCKFLYFVSTMFNIPKHGICRLSVLVYPHDSNTYLQWDMLLQLAIQIFFSNLSVVEW